MPGCDFICLRKARSCFFLQGGQAGLGLALRQLEKRLIHLEGIPVDRRQPGPAPQQPGPEGGGVLIPPFVQQAAVAADPHRPFQGVVGAGAARQLEPFGGQVLQTPALDLGRVDASWAQMARWAALSPRRQRAL